VSLVGVLVAAGLSYYLWPVGADTPMRAESQGMLAADDYALFFYLAILAAAALALLFSVEYSARIGLAQGEYYTLLLLSTAGMMLMAAAVNLVTLFLALEILSLALYVLVGLDRAERRSGEAALKYLVLGAFASGFLLYGMALIYGQAGTTSFAGVRAYIASLSGDPSVLLSAGMSPLLLVGLGLMIIGLGFKVALVPFHMWVPDVYHGAPTSVTAFMSVGTKAACFAALVRVMLYIFGDLHAAWGWVLAALATLTMTAGNLAALRQNNLKRMLAYSSIAHAGYILIGIAAGNQAGSSAVLFYLVAYAFMNIVAFAVLIAVGKFDVPTIHDGLRPPSRGETLEDLAGLGTRKPGLAAAMALSLLSLAGMPPLVGFLAKLYIFSAAVESGFAWLAVVGVVNSVLSVYYYLRVVVTMYMTPAAGRLEGTAGRKPAWEWQVAPVCPALQVGVAVASVVTVVLGLWPAPILDLARATVAALVGG
jgi:NADH-quinone oxidoreductase subunit N